MKPQRLLELFQLTANNCSLDKPMLCLDAASSYQSSYNRGKHPVEVYSKDIDELVTYVHELEAKLTASNFTAESVTRTVLHARRR